MVIRIIPDVRPRKTEAPATDYSRVRQVENITPEDRVADREELCPVIKDSPFESPRCHAPTHSPSLVQEHCLHTVIRKSSGGRQAGHAGSDDETISNSTARALNPDRKIHDIQTPQVRLAASGANGSET
jgi:hypothetical protein